MKSFIPAKSVRQNGKTLWLTEVEVNGQKEQFISKTLIGLIDHFPKLLAAAKAASEEVKNTEREGA